jgi:8-oxo-dGTP pyrophosphatase MutT (NUDIX family)
MLRLLSDRLGYDMRWKIHGERALYESPWVGLFLADVELPDGTRYEHHVVKLDPVAATVVLDDQRRVLMLWRHRFTTDTWNWEIPSGIVEQRESLEAAAAREVEEETGWRPGPLQEIAYIQPIGGMTNAEHHVFQADGAEYIGPPQDRHEADRVEWVPLDETARMIERREIVAGVAVVGLLSVLSGVRLGH